MAATVRLLDRYLLAEWLKVFGLALAATLAVLVLMDLYGDVGDLLGYQARPAQVALYFALLVPSYLPAVLPVSQFVSLLFALGALHRHNEIIALRAAGLSLWRIAVPFWLGGAVLALLLWWLNASLVPWSVEQSRNFRENLRVNFEVTKRDPDKVGLLFQLTYANQAERRLWFINRFQDRSDRGWGVSVYEVDERGRDRRRVLAAEGRYDEAGGHWVLQRGREILFDPDDGKPVSALPFEERAFPELRESPVLLKALRQRPVDLSLGELHALLAQVPVAENPAMNAYAVEYHSILASPFLCLIVVGFAVPFAVAGVRVSPMVGVSKAVGLFFVFHVLSNLCAGLGNQQLLAPALAAWLPNLVMLGLGAWLFRRAA